ncbi:GNAT family N-acetyltransferase [Bdellovibrio sp. HCB290]|uniref:GNAT family N-acetyltransferase n=1 Tax=Bdellovibrio sp. HCB290 TaxID=3394356 RepID=UPI0039B4E9DF
MRIRSALPTEASILSDLAFRSKSHWPYDKSALNEYRTELEVFTEDILADSVYVAEKDNQIIGFYGLSSDLKKERLYFLFVEPTHISKGVGKALWNHALSNARDRGWTALSFYADGYAFEAFYKFQGCRIVGSLHTPLGSLTEMAVQL